MNRHAEIRRFPRSVEIERLQSQKTGVWMLVNRVIATDAAEDRFVVSE